jgi:hypothetical protein
MTVNDIVDPSYYVYVTKLITSHLDYFVNQTNLCKKLDLRVGFRKLTVNTSHVYASDDLNIDNNQSSVTSFYCDNTCALRILQYQNKSISAYLIDYPFIDESRHETNTLCFKKPIITASTTTTITTKTTTLVSSNIITKTYKPLCPSNDPIHVTKEKLKIENKRILEIKTIKEKTKERIEQLKDKYKLTEYGRKGFALIAIVYLSSMFSLIVFLDFPKLIQLIKSFKNK